MIWNRNVMNQRQCPTKNLNLVCLANWVTAHQTTGNPTPLGLRSSSSNAIIYLKTMFAEADIAGYSIVL